MTGQFDLDLAEVLAIVAATWIVGENILAAQLARDLTKSLAQFAFTLGKESAPASFLADLLEPLIINISVTEAIAHAERVDRDAEPLGSANRLRELDLAGGIDAIGKHA